jgi:RHS repeat-associated protein
MRIGSTTRYYLLSDHLGGTNVTVTTSGTEYGEVRYKAFGDTRYTSGTTPTTFKFTGQRQESSLGIYYYGARWYDSSLGRWLSPDSIIPAQQGVVGNDRYAYSNNNPVRFIDPSGHSVDCALGEEECNAGELPPSSLIDLYSEYYDLDNTWIDNQFRYDLDDYLRAHPGYRLIPGSDPRMDKGDEIRYWKARSEYWTERAGGNKDEAYKLERYYDWGGYNEQKWDSSMVDWGNVALDAAGLATSIVGLNEVASALKLGKGGTSTAQIINFVSGVYSTRDSYQNGDGIGTIFNGLSFVPGPIGAVGAGAALMWDLQQGWTTAPYTPSVPR